jgi:hypothetical protein
MRRAEFVILILLGGVLLYLYARNTGTPLQPGEKVTPVWSGNTHWYAGHAADLSVRLQAENADGSSTRPLDFSSLPAGAHPKATITFHSGSQPMETAEVALTRRC